MTELKEHKIIQIKLKSKIIDPFSWSLCLKEACVDTKKA